MNDLVTFKYEGADIRVRDNALCLTDMWRASGAVDSKRPADWTASTQAKELLAFLQDSLDAENSGIGFFAEKGGPAGGATWAHWHLAFAYAKYLSPAFHVWCNEVVKRHLTGTRAVSRDAEEIAEMVLRRVLPSLIDAVAASSATIGDRSAKRLLSRVRELAAIDGSKRGSKAWKSRHRSIQNDLRDRCHIQHSGAWSSLPAKHLPDLMNTLDRMFAEERRRGVTPQLSLVTSLGIADAAAALDADFEELKPA